MIISWNSQMTEKSSISGKWANVKRNKIEEICISEKYKFNKSSYL